MKPSRLTNHCASRGFGIFLHNLNGTLSNSRRRNHSATDANGTLSTKVLDSIEQSINSRTLGVITNYHPNSHEFWLGMTPTTAPVIVDMISNRWDVDPMDS